MSAQNVKGTQSNGRTKPLNGSEADGKALKPVAYLFNHSITPIYDLSLHKKIGKNESNGNGNGKSSNTFEIPDADVDKFLSDPQGFLSDLAKKKHQEALTSIRSDSPIAEQIL